MTNDIEGANHVIICDVRAITRIAPTKVGDDESRNRP